MRRRLQLRDLLGPSEREAERVAVEEDVKVGKKVPE